jgi:glycine/D-amino acid oxidase-like deaminating enzyme
MTSRTTDALIIGDGVIGLSTAYELARAGASCCVVGATREGAASGAAAGLLAPSIGQLRPDVLAFFNGSLDLYPALIGELQEFDPGLRLLTGLIELSTPRSTDPNAPLPVGASRLTPSELASLEPSVDSSRGGVLHARDGAIDNVRLIAALRRAIDHDARVERIDDDPAVCVDVSANHAVVTLHSGSQVHAGTAVLAAGAWSPFLRGLPRPLPISPLKGQMLALDSTALEHPLMGDDIYLVPRAHEIAVGATVEDAGFDTSTDAGAIEALRQAAVRLVPSLENAAVARRWAGIRPATPDRLPIIGRDPGTPRLIYACGHSKNGILLAPATASAVASLLTGRENPWDLAPFLIERFVESGLRAP